MQILHDPSRHAFASDNLSGAHPRILAALSTANLGHTNAYGEDEYTAAFGALARELFSPAANALPVLNGTGANLLALQALTPRYGAVLTASTSHIVTDEAGGPERNAGLKLVAVEPARDGKLVPAQVHAAAVDLGNQHHAQPTTLSFSNVTEAGTVYTAAETAALVEAAHAHGMLVHVDGSRLGHASVSTGSTLAQLTCEAGVDAISLGGTKNGALLAEAVVTFSDAAAHAALHLRKSTTQLVSKARFVSAQLLELYGTELWRENASNTLERAAELAAGLGSLPGVTLVHPVQANIIWAAIPQAACEALRERFVFHGPGTLHAPARLMTSFDTTPEHIRAFLDAARSLLA